MKGDYHGYMVELKVGDEKKVAVEDNICGISFFFQSISNHEIFVDKNTVFPNLYRLPLLKHYLSQKLKVIGRDEFNHLIYI
jgi:hypothetical protein